MVQLYSALQFLHSISVIHRDVKPDNCIVSTTTSSSIYSFIQSRQWRSKALRGPGSTVTWGPSLSFPLHFPLPPLPLPFPSSSPALTPCHEAAPKSSYRIWGSAVSSPSGVWGGAPLPQPKSNLVHFILKIRHLVATILMVFLRVLSKIFLWPHYSGAPGARGPRFIEPLTYATESRSP